MAGAGILKYKKEIKEAADMPTGPVGREAMPRGAVGGRGILPYSKDIAMTLSHAEENEPKLGKEAVIRVKGKGK